MPEKKHSAINRIAGTKIDQIAHCIHVKLPGYAGQLIWRVPEYLVLLLLNFVYLEVRTELNGILLVFDLNMMGFIIQLFLQLREIIF